MPYLYPYPSLSIPFPLHFLLPYQTPPKYLKTLLGNKKRPGTEVISLIDQVSAIMQGTWAKKEKAEGPFVLCIALGKL